MTKLEETFHLFNSRYFRNSLPKSKVIWVKLKKDNLLGQYYPVEYTRKCGYTGKEIKIKDGHVIEIASEYKHVRRVWTWVLLHEMVHLKLNGKDRGDGHGHLFQREMKRLANAGAFNGLW